jgi:hypothetical protein
MLNAFTRAPDGVRTSQARLTSNDVSWRREVLGGFAPLFSVPELPDMTS